MQEKQAFTNANTSNISNVSSSFMAVSGKEIAGVATPEKEGRVSITAREAMEYCEFKRQQKRAEILSAISKSEGVIEKTSEVSRTAERATKLQQAAVRIAPSRLEAIGNFFHRRAVALDCVIGGNGETLTKVKRYEAKMAMKLGAKEITLVLSPYAVTHCRYDEIGKEMRKMRRATKRVKLKVWVDKSYPQSTLSRLARMCSEMKVDYFCVPYFDGCEKLRIDLTRGCKLQVSDLENLEQYKKMVEAGTQRILTEWAWEFYQEWLQEVEKINFPQRDESLERSVLPTESKADGVVTAPQTAISQETPILLPAATAKQENMPQKGRF